MPKAVEKCVSSLMAKWAKDPSSRPPPRKKGKDGKSQDAKSQAWAICTASYQKSHGKALEIMLEGGYGPTFIGAAATNRPYIPKLEESRMEEVDGEQKIIVHLANPGFFNHPTGPFVLNRAIFSNMINNFETVVLGQKSAYDSRHKPELGALGWFEKLWVDENGRFWGQVDPTTAGKDLIGGKSYLYSSMEFHRNYQRDDVKLDLEDATEDFCVLNLEDGYETELEDLGYMLQDEKTSNSAAIEKFKNGLSKFVSSDKEVLLLGKYDGDAPPGLVKSDGYLFIGKDAARAYLAAMDKKKAELEDLDIVLLYNPYHDKEDGKFTTATGKTVNVPKGVRISSKPQVDVPKAAIYGVLGWIGGGITGGFIGTMAGWGLSVASGGKVSDEAALGLGQLGSLTGSILGAGAMVDSVLAEHDKNVRSWEKRTLARINEAKKKSKTKASEDDSMNDEERIQLEQELEEEREKRQEEQERIKALEKERDAAMDKALKLEQEAMDSAVASVVNLAVNHRDKNGMALPRVFAEWVKKVLSFGEFGEDGDVVKLEQEERPGAEVVRYLTGAIQSLVLEMPGTIPAERITQSGKGQTNEDDFEYAELWADKKKGD